MAFRVGGFIGRHWRGELALWVSYWVICVAPNILTGLVFAFLPRMLGAPAYEPLTIFLGVVALLAANLVLAAWQAVGVWRAAGRYRTARRAAGRWGIWGPVARVAIVVGVLQAALFYAGIVPMGRDMVRIVFQGDPDIPSYSLRVMRNGTEIEISGGIKGGLNSALVSALRKAPGIKVVHLTSGGGRLSEARRLAHTIHLYKLDTYVPVECDSACTVVFAAGRERWLLRGATLGFHQASLPSKFGAALAIADGRDAYLELNLDPAFVEKAFNTPADTLWKPSADELLAAHVVTRLSDGSQFAISGFGAVASRADLAANLQASDYLLKKMATGSPADFEKIADVYYEDYTAGRTINETVADAKPLLRQILRSRIAVAGDRALMRFKMLSVARLRALRSFNPRLCYELATRGTNTQIIDALPQDLVDRERRLYADLFDDVGDGVAGDPDELRRLWREIKRQAAGATTQVGVDLLDPSKAVANVDFYAACDAAIAIYGVIDRMDDHAAAMVIRDTLAIP